MDNPGLAFLKQMSDERILRLVFPKIPNFHQKCLEPVDYTQAQTIKIIVINADEKQMSIERHYLIPTTTSIRQLMIFSYVILRARILKLCYKLMKLKWNDLNSSEMKTFNNREGEYIQSRKRIRILVERMGIFKFENIIKVAGCHRVPNETSGDGFQTKMKMTGEMTREELFQEFHFFFGKQEKILDKKVEKTDNKPKEKKSQWDDFDFEPKIESGQGAGTKNKESEPNLLNFVEKVETTGILGNTENKTMEGLELRPWDQCLFQLGIAKSIENDEFKPLMLNKAGSEDYIDLNNRFITIKMNDILLDARVLKLKRCATINMNIEIDKNITLNDCLSWNLFPTLYRIFEKYYISLSNSDKYLANKISFT